jgi:two-component system response regulator YesN
MMVRVLVVDDEKEIRNGLVTQLPWAEWGVDEVLDSDDGDTALELAMRCRPDLIITDIRMPRMSGLQLIEELARNRYDCGFIVISGFDDFHYAKEALKLGVSDYLLKPISKDELSKAVAVSLQRRRDQNTLEENRNIIQQGYELAIPRMREEILRELIERPCRESQFMRIEHKLKQLKLDWLFGVQLRMIIFGIDSLKALTGNEFSNDKERLLMTVGNILEHFFGEQQLGRYVLFRSKEDDWIALFENAEDDLAGLLDALSEEACERIRGQMNIRIHRGIADGQGSIQQVFDLHRRAAESMVYLKVHGSAEGDREEESDSHDGLELQLANSKELVEILKYGTEQDIRQAMHSYPRLVKFWQVNHSKDLQQRTFEWLLDIFRTAQKTTGWKETSWEKHPITLWEHLEAFDTLESLQEQVSVQLLLAAESMKGQSDPRSQIVHEAQRIILRCYQDNLTLHSVAEQVHVTPVWLSKLFKKETDMNFLEYLTDIRMIKAAELLADLNHKVYQVSYMIGYQDPVHFAKLFKRKYGCTPQEFRNSKGNQNE